PTSAERAPRASGEAKKPSRPSSCLLRLERVVDAVEDPRKALAERRQDGDRNDRDEGKQERVLHQRLPLLAIPQGQHREVGPHGERTNHLHLCPPSEGRRMGRRTLLLQGSGPAVSAPRWREMPSVATGDRTRRAPGPPQEGWDSPVLRSNRTPL